MEKITYTVRGMHCPACEHVIERKLRKLAGVSHISVNRSKDTATLQVTEGFSLDEANSVLGQAGYELIEDANRTVPDPMAKVWWTLVICVLAVGLVWMFANGGIRGIDAGKLTDNVGIGSAFVLGLIASISSCLAVTGGLLLALTANVPNDRKWNFAFSFGAGRLLSYGVLGGLLGAVGAKIGISTTASAVLTIIISVIMILLGLQMIGIFKMPSFVPKKFVHGIENMTKNPRQTAIEAGLVGALTFFLPCGFTQALQLFALQSGSFWTGGSILFVFALGTLPVLMFLGGITKYISQSFRRGAMTIAGIVVIILAVMSIPSAVTLYSAGSGSSSGSVAILRAPPADLAPVVNGVQQITTTVNGYSYSPNKLTVKAGVPVKWTVNGQGAVGCAKSFIAPEFGVRKVLSSTDPTIIEFTPTRTGTFKFTCSMGMAGPGTIIVV